MKGVYKFFYHTEFDYGLYLELKQFLLGVFKHFVWDGGKGLHELAENWNFLEDGFKIQSYQ